MHYASLTRNDRNPFKRHLQRRRLADALALISRLDEPKTILDYGAGDGETCRQLAEGYRQAQIICYEPCEALLQEARQNLSRLTNCSLTGNLSELPAGGFDLVLCMEVFEHLPPESTERDLVRIESLLRPGGHALIGVPLEIHLPAILKGAFRMTRRWGHFDALPSNILRAAIGRPPQERPLAEIAPGLPYHFHHMGFDHRRLQKQLAARFQIERVVGSPLPPLGTLLNSEVYFLVRRRAAATSLAA